MSGAERDINRRQDRSTPPPARSQVTAAASRWKVFLLCMLSVGGYTVIHAAIEWWPIAYLCLVPWVLAVVRAQRARWLYFCSWLFGFVFYILNLYWMWDVTAAGAVALALFQSIHFPIMAWPLRHMRRERGWPLYLLLPPVWVAGELSRATSLSGFPWFFLSHSHYRVLPMIQISDLVGAYGLSFVIAAVNGLAAEMLVRTRPAPRLFRPAVIAGCVMCVALVCAALGYGHYRLGQDSMRVGPLVAAVQGNHPSEVIPRPDSPGPQEKFALYDTLVAQVRTNDPDLFVLPETPWYMILNKSYWHDPPGRPPEDAWWSKKCHDYFARLAASQGAYVVVGAISEEVRPTQVYPTRERFNSAFVFAPGSDDAQRYDKVHLVPFGESVPFRGGRLHFLYRWLNDITPWGASGIEYSSTPGREFKVFEMTPKSQPRRRYRFGIPICYEDVMPYVSRRFVLGPEGSKQADFLLNISNDGWFHWGFELTQHLAASVFRAVENRVGVARAVNTGISAIINPDGRVVRMVQVDGRTRGEGIVGSVVGPLMTDSRLTLYTRTGDVFAVGCCLIAGMMLADAMLARWVAVTRRNPSNRTGHATAEKG